MNTQPNTIGSPVSDHTHLVVTQMPDGRYCVVYTAGKIRRRSYTPALDQVIRQAQLAGGIPISTDDETLRQRCQEAGLPLLNMG